MNTATSTLPLRWSDLDRLHWFRIDDDLIELHQIRRVTDSEARYECGIHYAPSSDLTGILFPIFGADGTIKGYRVRRDNPEIEAGKPKAKYVQSLDRPHLYFDQWSRRWLSDPTVPVIFVEACTSALALASLCRRTGRGYLIVATAGCWGWRATVGKATNENGVSVDEKGPSPDLDHIAFNGRKVILCFDSNVATNTKVLAAERAFQRELTKRGAVIHCARIPNEEGVNGPDDFLRTHSDDEFLEVLDSAGRNRPARSSIAEEPWPEEIDPAALHGLAGEIVRMIDPHTEADPLAILTQTLTYFGGCAGRNAYYQVEADRHYMNLNVCLVGDTSKARKGTSKGQVSALYRSVDEYWEMDRIQSGLSSGEGLVWAVRDPILKREPIKEKGRVVEYQNVMVDEGVDDKRLVVSEAEFALILRVLGRDGNTLSAIIRNAWDNGNLRVLTKNSPAKATNAHISIVGHITAPELRRYLDSTEAANGFANRFLWVCVRRSKYLPEGGNIQEENFCGIVRRLQEALDFAHRTGRVQFDEEARASWYRVYAELSEGQPGLFGAVVARSEAQVIRLALIYAMLDCSPLIRQPHLAAALALWEYCEESAAYIFGDRLGDPMADEILTALRRNPSEGLARTEISALFGRNRTAGQIGRALGVLLKHGKARFETVESGGRPAEQWFAIERRTP